MFNEHARACKNEYTMRFPIWRFRHSVNIPIFSNHINIFLRLLSISAHGTGMDYNVIHDELNNQFYINLGQEKAVLEYQFLNGEKKIMDFYHTGVPESHRGKGLAGHLVKTAFSFVVAKNFKVRPTCSYVEHYINKNKPSEIIERLEK